MAGSGNSFSLTIEDWEGSKGTSNFNVGPITELNLLARRAGLNSLKLAIMDVQLGRVRQTNLTESIAQDPAAVSTSVAQRGNKWVVTIQDVTEYFDGPDTIHNDNYLNTYRVEIPCADTVGMALLPKTDTLILSGAGVSAKTTALIAAIESSTQSPWGGNEIKVLEIKQVNRNS